MTGLAGRMAAARAEVAQLLRDAGLNAFDHKPAQVSPPVAFVVPSEPWVTYGSPGENPFGGAFVNLDVVLAVTPTGNASALTDLEAMAAAAFEALAGAVGDVSAPYEISLTGIGSVLACAIDLPRIIDTRGP